MDDRTREEIERICIRNLMRAREERVFFKDLESRFLLVSAGWLAAEGQGRTLEDVVGKTDFDIFSLPHASTAFEDEQRIIRTHEPMIGKVERETFHNRPDAWVSTTKLPLVDEAGVVIGTFGIARDVSAQMQDAVTGVANRVALMDRLTQALVALERQPGRLAVLFLDVDGFKSINDSFGHHAGDRVLVEIARRLKAVARRFDTVARYGGDEFVVLSTGLADETNASLIAKRVIEALRNPIDVGHQELIVTASIGGVVVSDPAGEPEALIHRADAAMYSAKRAGGGRFEIVAPFTDGAVAAQRRDDRTH